jgi:hypothetical protein
MFRLQTETDLLNAFRPRDRKHVELPPGFRFPHFVRHYLAWSDPTGIHTYLVMLEPKSGRPMGIAFKRDHSGAGVPAMCDWCHSPGSSASVGLLSANANSKRIVGVHVCLDLGCAERVETTANLAGRSVRDLTDKVMERMLRFAREGLGIDFVPAS